MCSCGKEYTHDNGITLETMFSMQPMLRLYNKGQQGKLVVTQLPVGKRMSMEAEESTRVIFKVRTILL
jgi:hypothetical protein